MIVIPWEALGGGPSGPADIPGFGLADPEAARDLLAAACRSPQTRICVTVLGPDGTARLHGCVPGQPDLSKLTAEQACGAPDNNGPGPPGPDPGPGGTGPPSGITPTTAVDLIRRLKVRLTPITRDNCEHDTAEPGYTPSRRLAHLVRARNVTCTAPGCGAAAVSCDLDHTLAWDKGGITCECGLAPLCRHHHRTKQANGWRLEQPAPGLLTWRTPAGLEYTTKPTDYRAA
ncbi:MAG: HNH endonuclease [Streptosporangiaceae bacterium]|nr:HNH endonuclease [Streptosporangiaceae bacterium]